MAVALEVGWGSGELGGIARINKKRAWGDDHQKLLEMMMGKSSNESRQHQTLDLLGGRAASNAAATNIDATTGDEQSEFLELGQDVPLPSGWEKRLDLKSGTVFFINWNTGKTTYDDPRSSSGSSCHMSLELLQCELGKQHKPGKEIDKPSIAGNKVAVAKDDDAAGIESHKPAYRGNSLVDNGALDLKLNLSSKQEITTTTTSSSSDVITTATDDIDCLCLLPPSTATSSSPKSPPSQLKVTLTGCKRCLMYVMISQSQPWCPKCKSSVIMDFPVVKKQRKLDLEL